MDEVDWSSLHKTLSDSTRRSIIELLAEKQTLGYTEIMTLLGITNTGRLNYHLKALGDLISKNDEEGKYSLTERGQIAASLLKTFPERTPPEKKLSILKVAVAIALILVGILLIASFSIAVLSVPTHVSTSTQESVSDLAIPQNTTVSLPPWDLTGPVGISWSASITIYVYVLNQSQDDSLQLQHPASGQALLNFTGAPTSWVDRYYGMTGNSTLSLPQGEYYFFASSNTAAMINSFASGQTQQPSQSGSFSVSPLFYLFLAIFIAFGVVFIVLAFSILTRRVWR